MQLDPEALIEEAVQASIDAGLAVNGEYGVAASRHAARFMFNTLQAVQPVPVVKGSAPSAYLIERLAGSGYGSPRKVLDAAKYDPTQDEFWIGDAKSRHLVTPLYALSATASAEPVITDELRGQIAYQLTKRLVIDMPTARACVDDALKGFVHAASAIL